MLQLAYKGSKNLTHTSKTRLWGAVLTKLYRTDLAQKLLNLHI